MWQGFQIEDKGGALLAKFVHGYSSAFMRSKLVCLLPKDLVGKSHA